MDDNNITETNEAIAINDNIETPQTKTGNEVIERKPHKRIIAGLVVSDKPNKTIIVKYERQIAHSVYKKYFKKSKKLMAHDENNEAHIGDTVKIKECRPMSAKKRWELIEIIQRAK